MLLRFCTLLLLFVTYALVAGCSKNDIPFPRCISADYFGPEPITISSYFPIGHEAFLSENKESINIEANEISNNFHPDQVLKWKDTGLETNGDDLIVRISGAWISLNRDIHIEKSKEIYNAKSTEQIKSRIKSEEKKQESYDDNLNSSYSKEKFSIKEFQSSFSSKEASETRTTINSSNGISCEDNNKSVLSSEEGSPYWFTHGYGAYFLFKKPSDKNPNESVQSIRTPQSPIIHLGHSSIIENESGLFILDKNDRKLKDGNLNSLKLEKGWKIYTKIVDNHYSDNIGGYSLEFLSGVQLSGSLGLFDYIYNYLKSTLLINKDSKSEPAAAQIIFMNIAEKCKSFHNFVLSLLILFVMISSLLYLFGMIRETRYDIIIRIVKITVVVILISPGSFRFFYDYFLTLFIDGLEHTVNSITSFASNINYIHHNNWNYTRNIGEKNIQLFSFMEDMFNKFFAYSVWKKLTAFLHYQMWTSVLMIPAILVAIILYFLLCVYAYIIFLSGFIGIAFLIAIMPLFLVSILFSQMRSLFEGWIKFCTSFCLQSIMIFTLLSLLASSIMNTFYRQLGFTICYNKWLEVRLCAPKWIFDGFCIIDKQYFSWTPGQIFIPYSLSNVSSSNIDESSNEAKKLSKESGTAKFTGGIGYIFLPPDYLKKGFRYIDYPFFNPVFNSKENLYYSFKSELENDTLIDQSSSEQDLLYSLIEILSQVEKQVSEKADILALINSINAKIGSNYILQIVKRHCQDVSEECINYTKILNEIKFLLQNIIKNKSFNLFSRAHHGKYENYSSKRYQECKNRNCSSYETNQIINKDSMRIEEIQRGNLISIGEIFLLFILSFLMFSLREFVQQMASNIAGGGFSVYSISMLYEAFPIVYDINRLFKYQWQNFIGRKIDSLGNLANLLPNRLVVNTTNLLGKVPRVGNILKYSIKAPHKFIEASAEVAKFVISPQNDVNKFEEKIYKHFEIDKNDITYRRISKHLSYCKGYVGLHLNNYYTVKSTLEIILEHGINSIIGKHNNFNLLHRMKSHRRELLDRLYNL